MTATTSPATGPARVERPFPVLGLLALAAGAFLSLTSEVLPAGLLPEIGAAFDRDDAEVGLLVSAFAAVVVVLTLPLSHLLRRVGRKRLLLGALLVMAIAALGVVLAPDYGALLAARIVGGAAHGVFWSVVSAYPAHLVGRERLPQAMAMLAVGGSAATIVGVPLGTLLGQLGGWQLPFIVVAALMATAALVMAVALPAVVHHARESGTVTTSAPDASRVPVLLYGSAIVLQVTGHMAFFTYVIPWLRGELGLSESGSSLALLLFGVASTAGALSAAQLLRRRPALVLPLAAGSAVLGLSTAGALALLEAPAPVIAAALLLWAIGWGGVPFLTQTRMMAAASYRLRDTAATLHTIAFNIGMMTGPPLGALVLTALPASWLPWGTAVLVFGGALLACSANFKVR